MKFTAASVQLYPKLGEVEENLRLMSGLVEEAAQKDARLVVLPELATTGYEAGERFFELAEQADTAESVRVIGELCKKHGLYVAFGFAERDAVVRDVLYNSVALVGPEAELVGVYRKVHLFAGERNWFRPGCDFPVFSTDLGKLGIFVCWDVAFPEPARVCALRGADVLLLSSNYEKPYAEDWDVMCAARALDNVLPLVAANRHGADPVLDFFGHSRILDPLGRVLAKLDEERDGVIVAEIDTEEAIRRREQYYTFFKDRRPDTYSDLVQPM
jgi:predicted amidohydrolase